MANNYNIERIYSLTKMQEGILYHKMANQQSTEYFIQIRICMTGKMDLEKAMQSLSLLTEKYEVLRTAIVFPNKSDKPLQVVLCERKIECNIINLIGKAEQEYKIACIQQEDIQRGFDLKKDSLLRVTILQKSEDENVLLWSSHHIIMDGWCLSLLLRDFMQYYELLARGNTLSALKERVREERRNIAPYGEYINWLEKQDKEEGLSYWESLLEGYTEVAEILPVTQGNNTKEQVAEEIYTISKQLTEQLQKLSSSLNVTISTIVETVWGILLQKYNRNSDVVFGKVVSGRNADIQGIEQAVGLFINTIPTRVKCEEGVTAKELLEQMQRQSIESMKYDYCPLVEVQGRSELGNSLVRTIFVFENYYIDNSISKGIDGIKINVESSREQTNYDISLYAFINEALTLKIMYDPSKYIVGEIITLLSRMELLFNQIIANPEKRISNLSMVNEKDKKLIVETFNDTDVEYPKDKTVVQLFEEQVEKTPKNIALVFEDQEITYAELNAKANQLARKLRNLGLKPNDLVAIISERSHYIVVAMLSVLKAGGAYVPIDPSTPVARIKNMIHDSGCKCVLAYGEAEDAAGIPILRLDDENILDKDSNNLDRVNTTKDLCYVIYTSGSTGMPKGTMLMHSSVVNYCSNNIYNLCGGMIEQKLKRIVSVTTLAFDIFVTETIMSLLNGMTTVIANEIQQNSPKAFFELLCSQKVEILQTTPSKMRMYLSDTEQVKNLSGLQAIFLGGEKFDNTLLKIIRKYTEAKIVNVYGPTETTVWSTAYNIPKEQTDHISVGKPIANTQIYILDGDELCGIGIPGELCIAGAGLAKGYLNQPELTEKKFVRNPFGEDRMYRTGDLARWLPDGSIDCLGRIDEQIKLRGFRIELGEIESILLKQDTVKDVAVAVKEKNGDKSICAYVVSDIEICSSDLKDSLRTELPEYMIPAYIMQIDSIPVTKNGKLDRKALPQPELANEREYIAPRNITEEAVAAIFAEILGINPVSIEDNFFEMGGDSIKAIRMVSKMREAGYELALKDLMQLRVVKLIAEKVAISEKSIVHKQEEVNGQVPTTQIQNRFFQWDFIKQQHYNQTIGIEEESKQKYLIDRIIGESLETYGQNYFAHNVEHSFPLLYVHKYFLNEIHNVIISKFEVIDSSKDNILTAIHNIISSQSALRTKYNTQTSCFEEYSCSDNWKVPYIDLEGINISEELFMQELQKKIQEMNFISEQNLLSRIIVVKKAGDIYSIVLCVHHCIWDGMSSEIFETQFRNFICNGKDTIVKYSYSDYIMKMYHRKEEYKFTYEEEQMIKQYTDIIDLFLTNCKNINHSRNMMSVRTNLSYNLRRQFENKPIESIMTLMYGLMVSQGIPKHLNQIPYFMLYHNRNEANNQMLGLVLDVRPYVYNVQTRQPDYFDLFKIHNDDIMLMDKIDLWWKQKGFNCNANEIPGINWLNIFDPINNKIKSENVETVIDVIDNNISESLSIVFSVIENQLNMLALGLFINDEILSNTLRDMESGLSE